MYFTKEQLRELDEAGKRGAALREAVERKILTEKQAEEIISRPRIEEDEAVGAKLVPFPRKVNLKEAISLAEKAMNRSVKSMTIGMKQKKHLSSLFLIMKVTAVFLCRLWL